MAEVLNTEERVETGSKRMRRLRNAGFIPAVLYGENGGPSVALSIPTRDVDAAIRFGSQIVRLEGKVTEDALIKDVQWDAFGREVLHLDLTKVDLTQSITVSLSVEIVGDAPGARQGGQVKQLVQEVEVECPANALPEKLELRINDLELGQSLAASDIPLPDGASIVGDAANLIVQCIAVDADADEAEEAAGDAPAEPEVIGRKADDEGEGE